MLKCLKSVKIINEMKFLDFVRTNTGVTREWIFKNTEQQKQKSFLMAATNFQVEKSACLQNMI